MKVKNKIIIFFIIFSVFIYQKVYSANGNISINFDDVDIKLAIKTFSEIFNKNIIYPPEINGKISISAPQKVDKKEALKILSSVLREKGYLLIEKENYFVIIPAGKTSPDFSEISYGKNIPEKLIKKNAYTIHLVKLKYANPEKIKKAITPFSGADIKISVEKDSNSILLSGKAKEINKMLNLIRIIDSNNSNFEQNKLYVIKCKNISSDKAAESLNTLFTKKIRNEGIENQGTIPTFISHKESNSIIILSDARSLENIKQVLKKIDVPKKQILVKAVVAEITEQTAKKIGFDILSTGGVLYATKNGFSKISESGINSTLLSGADAQNSAVSYSQGIQNYPDSKIPDIGWVIQLSKQYNGIDILSTPKLITADNEEAEIIVGKNLAFLKDSQVTPQGGTVKTFDFKDVGLKLKIKPRIGENGIISLNIEQQYEEVIGTSFEGGIETSKRSINTTVILKNGALAVLGGLSSNIKNNYKEGPPILSDIPIINLLFRKKSTKTEKKNLILFITAQILKTPEDLQKIANQETANLVKKNEYNKNK